MNAAIAEQRLHNQYITRGGPRQPAEVVAWLGAVQAQEYAPAKWALALRMRAHTTEAEIEHAFNEGQILRTHILRPTWHFVTPADIHWMLGLTAPRVHRRMSYYNRQLGLDAATLNRGAAVFERALRNGQNLIRAELGVELERAGIATNGVRLARLAMYAELEGVICSGPRRGKQFTYALLANRAPHGRRLSRDEALAELTRRYFRSHGPATTRDFAWWSGLTTADAKRGLEINRARQQVVDGHTYWTLGRKRPGGSEHKILCLLPIYDEYLVAYRDREAVPHAAMLTSSSGGFARFRHALVIAGQVAGCWSIIQNANGLTVDVIPLRRLTIPERRVLADATARYGRFLNIRVGLSTA